jgi:sugar phosphate isomerase/epimerase
LKIEKNKIFYHVAVGNLLDDIGYYLGLGVNFEIYVNSEFIDNHKPQQIDFINTQFRKTNTLKRVHGPFMDLSPASPDDKIRSLSIKRLMAGLDICRKLKCDNIVLHSHYDPVYHKRHFDIWKENSKTAWQEISDYVNKFNITVNIENSEDDTPDAILYLIKEYPVFKACFDFAHYTVFGTMDWKGILKRYPNGSINEVHLSDNDTTEDQHLVLGKGSVEIKKFLSELELLGVNAAITVEPHTRDEMSKDIEYMRDFS